MKYLFPESSGLPEEPVPPAEAPPIDGNSILSPAGVMYSTLLQLRTDVETEKLERTILKQLVQRLQRDFALLQNQIDLLDQPTTSKFSSIMSLESKIRVLEKRLSTETCLYSSRLNSLQHQLSTMGDQICQFKHSNSNFIWWKVTSIQLVFESARLWYLKPGRENAPTTGLRSPIFRSHPNGYNFYLNLYPYGFGAAIGTWASISPSISAGEYDDILPRPVSKTIQIKMREQLNSLNTWIQTIESEELTRPASAENSTVPTVRYPYFFPHSKLFNEADCYLYNDTMYLEISFFDPPIPPNQSSLLFLFPSRPPIIFNTLSVRWVVAWATTLSSASFKIRNNIIRVITVTYRLKG